MFTAYIPQVGERIQCLNDATKDRQCFGRVVAIHPDMIHGIEIEREVFHHGYRESGTRFYSARQVAPVSDVSIVPEPRPE